MPIATTALIASAPSASFTQGTIEHRDLGPHDILIDIAFVGICHSDIHQVRNEWHEGIFPMVPGHEIAGTVAEVGSNVTAHAVGDRVGVGCMVDSCGECEFCAEGEEQHCARGAVMTYNGLGYDGQPTYGGYARRVVVDERFALRIPLGIELDVAAPLLCAGVTVWTPLQRWGAGPGKRLAVIGLGGLGHMAVQLGAALGADVTVLSRTDAKRDDALKLGASDVVATGEDGALEALKGRFDLIINTVSANLPIADYLALLRPTGVLANVGAPTDAYVVPPFSIVGGSRVLAGSNIGGIPGTQAMLDFCGEHGIGAVIERIGADEVDDAYERVVAGDVRFRVVIDVASIDA